MTSKKDLFTIYIFVALELLILLNSHLVIDSAKSSMVMFITKVFPSLFPPMVIGNILIKENIHMIIPKFIKKTFNKLFNFNDVMTGIFITSMFVGTPSNALYINDSLDKGLISEKEAEVLVCSTHFINPLFVIGGVGIYVFNDSKIGFLLLLLIWVNNFIKAFLNRKKIDNKNIKKIESNNMNLINAITTSIKSSINALLLIFGIIIMFSILITLIGNIFNLPKTFEIIIGGLLEMTSGVIKVSSASFNNIIKFILCYYFLNFGGLCIQMQTFGMFKNKKIRYLKYLIFRLF